MQQALAQFKSQYGVHPPSRIILSETGDYSTATISNQTGLSANYAAALAQRSVSYLRRIWPRMILSTTGPIINAQTKVYDFTGTGFTDAFGKQVLPTVHGIQGAECLVFFLGGIPQRLDSGGYAVVGFAKNPQNPMLNADTAHGGTTNRSAPLFEFRPGRLVDLDATPNGFPEYLDGLGGISPRPYVYFSAYEGQGYDPDDNNYFDAGDSPLYPNGVFGGFSSSNAATPKQFYNANTRPDIIASEAPNPYTVGSPLPVTATGDIDPTNRKPIEYVNKNSFQLFSAGIDNDFGIGGAFDSNNSQESLTYTANANFEATQQTLDAAIRKRERDNLTNFNNGTLD